MRFASDKPVLRIRADDDFRITQNSVKGINTICHRARCPNRHECFSKKTATFLLLGDKCTRNCLYCNIERGTLTGTDPREKELIAQAVSDLGLSYVVLTAVTRDDLPDQGLSVFADTVSYLKSRSNIQTELLLPDLFGRLELALCASKIDANVFAHNIEAARGVFPVVRPQGNYDHSIKVLRIFKEQGCLTKSGFMVGFGETLDDVTETMADLRAAGVDILTIGQYLVPDKRKNIGLRKMYSEAEFTALAEMAAAMGFPACAAGSLVRSSYHSAELYHSIKRR